MRPLSAPSLTRRWWAAGAGVVLLAGMLPAAADAAAKPIKAVGSADQAAKGEELANYDSRAELNADTKNVAATKAAGLAAQRIAAAEKPASPARKLRESLGVQGIVDIDNATGTPRRVAKING